MFSVDDLLWADFETASAVDLKAAGTVRYASDASTRAIALAYATGGATAHTWHADGAILDWDNAPDDLRDAVARGAIIAAWNASFDSAVWNYATLGFPFLAPERVIDPMIQAAVSNLPTDLQSASRYLNGAGKQADGKKLIKLSVPRARRPASIQRNGRAFSATRARMLRRCAMSIAARGLCRARSGSSIGLLNM
jgi:hypothetical protein